jgi:dCMP deaminase
MSIAKVVAQRSYDPRLKVGSIVVSADNTQMLSIGYNGNYKGGPHEPESLDAGQSGFIHSEANALIKCDFNFGKKKHMYLTHSPCRACAKLIVNAEIARVVYDVPYRDTSGLEILTSMGIEVFSLEEAIIRDRAL